MNTVSSTTSDREYIEINNSTYIVESYYTHSESYLTTAEQSSGMSDVTALTRESTSGTSYLTEIITTGTSYLTSASSKSNVSATQLYLNTLKSIYRGVIGYSKTQYGIQPGVYTRTYYSLAPVQPGLSSTVYRNNEYYNSGTVNFQETIVNNAATSQRATVYVQPIAVTTGTSYLTEEVTTGTSYLTCSSTSAYSGKSTSSNGNWE